MELTGEFLRGQTDAIILSVLIKGDNYGYQINQEISFKSDNTFMLTEATLYTAFKRLEKDNFIISYWMDGPNAKRKYYSITEEGRSYLENHKLQWEKAKIIIDKFIGGNYER